MISLIITPLSSQFYYSDSMKILSIDLIIYRSLQWLYVYMFYETPPDWILFLTNYLHCLLYFCSTLLFSFTTHLSPSESNPRVVSEEMYEFPKHAVEIDGTLDEPSSHHSISLPKPTTTERSSVITKKNNTSNSVSRSNHEVRLLLTCVIL